MDRRSNILACSLIAVELLIQIFGNIYYAQTPEFLWSLANAILILTPLAFGTKAGVLCLVPLAGAELVWSVKLHLLGPILHLASFTIFVVILGFAAGILSSRSLRQRIVISAILYEVSLIGEETLYYLFRMLFLHKPISWALVSETFLSAANPILLLALILILFHIGKRGTDGSR